MKVWRELWVHDPGGARKQFVMTFSEDGPNFNLNLVSVASSR